MKMKMEEHTKIKKMNLNFLTPPKTHDRQKAIWNAACSHPSICMISLFVGLTDEQKKKMYRKDKKNKTYLTIYCTHLFFFPQIIPSSSSSLCLSLPSPFSLFSTCVCMFILSSFLYHFWKLRINTINNFVCV